MPEEPKSPPGRHHRTEDDRPGPCACGQDPFAALPPELRPKTSAKLSGLRKVTCPVCGLGYWTNRPIDVCPDCEKKMRAGAKEPPAEKG